MTTNDRKYLYRLSDITIFDQEIIHCLLQPISEKLLYKAGQYCKIIDKKDVARFFSIANAPNKGGLIELLIRKTETNQTLLDYMFFSKEIWINGPYGKNIYRKNFNGPIVLLVYGMGIAQSRALLQQAIIEQDKRQLFLIWIAKRNMNEHFQAELHKWEETLLSFNYYIVSESCNVIANLQLRYQLNLSESLIFASGPYEKIKNDLQQCKRLGVDGENFCSDIIDLYGAC